MRRAWNGLGALAAGAVLASALGACEVEKRAVGPSPPLSPPTGRLDPRAQLYEKNVYQVGEGGRMFRWNGCDSCHTETAQGAANLTDHLWRYGGTTAAIYASIAQGRPDGMPAYKDKVTDEQIWQMAGYLHGLPDIKPAQRQRQSAAQAGEPQGSVWKGPIG